MINLTFDITTGVARATQSAAVLVVGADVPISLIFSAAPGSVDDIKLALGTDESVPRTLAFTEDFSMENETTWTAILDANDTRLVAFMANKPATTINLELVSLLDGVRQVAPHIAVTAQPRIISGPETSEGGPDYLTDAETLALLAPPDGTFKIEGASLKLWNATQGIYQTISLAGAAGAETLVVHDS